MTLLPNYTTFKDCTGKGVVVKASPFAGYTTFPRSAQLFLVIWLPAEGKKHRFVQIISSIVVFLFSRKHKTCFNSKNCSGVIYWKPNFQETPKQIYNFQKFIPAKNHRTFHCFSLQKMWNMKTKENGNNQTGLWATFQEGPSSRVLENWGAVQVFWI